MVRPSCNIIVWFKRDVFSANVHLAPVSVSCYKKLYFFLNDLNGTSTSTAQFIENVSKLQKWNVDNQIAVSPKYGRGKICKNILGWSGLHKVFYRLNTSLPCLVQTLTKNTIIIWIFFLTIMWTMFQKGSLPQYHESYSNITQKCSTIGVYYTKSYFISIKYSFAIVWTECRSSRPIMPYL